MAQEGERWGRLESLTPKGTSFDCVEDSIFMGRDPEVCHPSACFGDEGTALISKRHCRLIRCDVGVFRVEDTSSNGTFINGHFIGKGKIRRLRNGDTLSFVVKDTSDDKYDANESIMYTFEAFETSARAAAGEVSSEESEEVSSVADDDDDDDASADFAPVADKMPSHFITQISVNGSPQVYTELVQSLEVESDAWLRRFVNLGGLGAVTDAFMSMSSSKDEMDQEAAVLALRAIELILNEKYALQRCLAEPGAVTNIVLSMDTQNDTLRCDIPRLLAAIVAYSDDGYSAVMAGFDTFHRRKRERVRFAKLIQRLSRGSIPQKVNIMILINNLLNMCPNFDARLHLRQEFLDLDVKPMLDGFALFDDPELDAEISTFVAKQDDDRKESTALDLNFADPIDMAHLIQIQVRGNNYRHFVNILQSLSLFPMDVGLTDDEAGRRQAAAAAKAWSLAAEFLATEAARHSEDVAAGGDGMLDLNDLREALEANIASKEASSRETVLERERMDLTEKLEALRSQMAQTLKEAAVEAEDREHRLMVEHTADIAALKAQYGKKIQALEAELATARASGGNAASTAATPAAEGSAGAPVPPMPVEGGAPVPPMPVEGGAPVPPMPVEGGAPVPPMPVGEAAPATDSAGGPPPPPPPGDAPPPPALPGGFPGAPPPPPAPGGGPGAPPPPPPPSMGAAKVEHPKPKVLPTKKLRNLHWNQVLPAAVQGSVWEDIDKEWSFENIPTSTLEDLFCQKASTATAESAITKSDAGADAKPKVEFFDWKRSNNIGVMMSQFRGVKPDELAGAILRADTEVLSADNLIQLEKNAPTPEETRMLLEYNGDVADLGKVEAFMMPLVKVPRLSNRLASLSYMAQFNGLLADTSHSLDALLKACQQVLRSKSFPKLLRYLLAVGNFMNYSKWKAPAYGFKVDFLTKLNDTKTTTGQSTALHWLATTLRSERRDLAKVRDELDMVEAGSSQSMAVIAADVGRLGKGLRATKAELEACQSNPTSGCKLREKLEPFVRHAESRVEFVQQRLEALRDASKELAAYLVEPQSSVGTPEEMLAPIKAFLLGLERCERDNERKAAMEERAATLRLKREQRLAQAKAKPASTTLQPRPSKKSVSRRRGSVLKDALQQVKKGKGRRLSTAGGGGGGDQRLRANPAVNVLLKSLNPGQLQEIRAKSMAKRKAVSKPRIDSSFFKKGPA